MPTKTPGKKATPKPTSDGGPSALQKPLQPSQELASVVGSQPLARGQVVSKVWDYIKLHNLQNPENRREILADETLKRVFWKGQGDHVRDEQTPRPAFEMTALRRGCFLKTQYTTR